MAVSSIQFIVVYLTRQTSVLSVLLKETLLTLLPSSFWCLFFCVLFVLCFRLFTNMFTLYGVLASPWRMCKRNNVNSSEVASKCSACNCEQSYILYQFTRCHHKFCYSCFKLNKTKRCTCPCCPKALHTYCHICFGIKP